MGRKKRDKRKGQGREKKGEQKGEESYHCGVCFEDHQWEEQRGVRCQSCGWISHCEESFRRWQSCCRCFKPMGPRGYKAIVRLEPLEVVLQRWRQDRDDGARLLAREVVVAEERKWVALWVYVTMLAVVCITTITTALLKDGDGTNGQITTGPSSTGYWCTQAPTAPSVERHWTGRGVHGRVT